MSGKPCHSELGNGGDSKGAGRARRGGSGSFDGVSLNSSTYALKNRPKKLLGPAGGLAAGSDAPEAGGGAVCWAPTRLATEQTSAKPNNSTARNLGMPCPPRGTVAIDVR